MAIANDPQASAALKAFIRRGLSRPPMLEGGPVAPRDFDPRAFPLAPPLPASEPVDVAGGVRHAVLSGSSQFGGNAADAGQRIAAGMFPHTVAPTAVYRPPSEGPEGPAMPEPADKSKYTYSTPEDYDTAKPTMEQRMDAVAGREGYIKRNLQSSALLPGDLPESPVYGSYKETGERTGMGEHPLVGRNGHPVEFSEGTAFLQLLHEKDPAKRAQLQQQADAEQRYNQGILGERQMIARQREMAAAQAPKSAEEKARLIEAEGNTTANMIRAGAARTTAEAGAAKTGAETAQLDPATVGRAQYLVANPGDFEGADRYAFQVAAAQGRPTDYGGISEEQARQLAAKQTHGMYENVFARNKLLNAEDIDLSQARIVPSARWHIFHNMLGTGTSLEVPDPKGGPGATETYQTDSADEEAKLRAAIDFVKARKALRPVTGRDDEVPRKPRY